jgi:predicted phosphodiesterase
MKNIVFRYLSVWFIGLIILFSCETNNSNYIVYPDSDNFPFFFIVLADSHISLESEKSMNNLGKAIEICNHLNPSFVIVCGDLIQTPSDQSQADKFLEITGQLDPEIPLFLCPGNHDIGMEPTLESLGFYKNKFGPDRYIEIFRNTGLVTINSSLIKNPGKLKNEESLQLTWLIEKLKDLKVARVNHIFLIMHYPLFLRAPNEGSNYYNIPPLKRKAYLLLLKQFNVTAVFAGHYHRNSLGTYHSIQMITTGPVGRPYGDDPSGLRIVKVFFDHIEHLYFGLDDELAIMINWINE